MTGAGWTPERAGPLAGREPGRPTGYWQAILTISPVPGTGPWKKLLWET
jgi:hypothetical protein